MENLALIVEDDDDDALFLIKALGDAGFPLQLKWARDGAEAMTLIESLRPALVILDIKLPKLDGLEVLRRMREIPGLEHSPAVVLTASTEEGDRQAAESLGVLLYLRKPTNTSYYPTLAQKICEVARTGCR
jgi:CheY-like chemotaxis protein